MNFLNAIWRSNIYYREKWIMRQLRALASGSRLLDAGCGGQPFRRYCQHLEYVSQDFAKLDARTQIVGGSYGPVDYECDIGAIPAPSGAFDAILCTEVLEHVPDPIVALKEFARLLRTGGTLIITAPLGSFLHQEPFHYYGGYTPYWYRRFLPETGFELRELEQNGGLFRFLGQECQRVTRTLFRRNHVVLRVLLMPLEFLSWIVLTVLIPTACYMADRAFPTPGITIGYHVLARRK